MSANYNESDNPRDPRGKFRDKPGANTKPGVALGANAEGGGDATQAARELWSQKDRGDFTFEENPFDGLVEIRHGNNVFVVSDDEVNGPGSLTFFSYTLEPGETDKGSIDVESRAEEAGTHNTVDGLSPDETKEAVHSALGQWMDTCRRPNGNESYFGKLDSGRYDFGPSCEAAHQAYVKEASGDFSFEGNDFDRNVAVTYGSHAMVLGDDEEGGYSYTLYEHDPQTGMWEDYESDGGDNPDDAPNDLKRRMEQVRNH